LLLKTEFQKFKKCVGLVDATCLRVGLLQT